MKKNITLITMLILGFFLFGVSLSSGAQTNHHRIPYGDYCSQTSHYGVHHGILNNSQVKKALTHYYSERGFIVELISQKGRFVKVKVKDHNTVVDIVIFDRHTGRIRSIE